MAITPNTSVERDRPQALLAGSLRRFAPSAAPHLRRWAAKYMSGLGRAVILIFLASLSACPAIADDGFVGIWSSSSRTKGGLGPQWIFSKDGRATHTFGALVDFKYEINGSQIKQVLLGPDRAETKEVSVTEFLIDGDTLTMNPRTPDRKQVMKRVGKPNKDAHSIVGEWTYKHYTGGPAQMRYSRSGVAQLTVPFQTLTGTYRATQATLSITLHDQQPMNFKFRRESDFLVLTDGNMKESKYQRFDY